MGFSVMFFSLFSLRVERVKSVCVWSEVGTYRAGFDRLSQRQFPDPVAGNAVSGVHV